MLKISQKTLEALEELRENKLEKESCRSYCSSQRKTSTTSAHREYLKEQEEERLLKAWGMW
jgi:hypothetical protein